MNRRDCIKFVFAFCVSHFFVRLLSKKTMTFFLPEIGAHKKAILSGINKLDDIKGGFHPGELTVIASRPSMGKTSFALTLTNHLVADTKDSSAVHFYSIEMAKEQMMYQLLAQRGDLSLNKVRMGKYTDDEFKRLVRAAAQFANAPLYIDDAASISPSYIRNQLAKAQSGSARAVIVDYLQLMSADQKIIGRVEEVRSILRDLKSIAVEFKVPVIVLAQLNRGVEGRVDRRPVLSDLREIETTEFIDSTILLYRDIYYDGVVRPDEDLMSFRILTNKYGGCGWADCDWNRETLKIG